MSAGWICPVCGLLNSADLVVCERTTEHDQDAVTYEQAIGAAAQILADARARMATLTPRQAALEAYVPGGPTVAELEDRIRRLRADTRRAAA